MQTWDGSEDLGSKSTVVGDGVDLVNLDEVQRGFGKTSLSPTFCEKKHIRFVVSQLRTINYQVKKNNRI